LKSDVLFQNLFDIAPLVNFNPSENVLKVLGIRVEAILLRWFYKYYSSDFFMLACT